jgi:hypothetical protein
MRSCALDALGNERAKHKTAADAARLFSVHPPISRMVTSFTMRERNQKY